MLVVWFGTPCNTMTSARRLDGGPPPIRTDEYPEGLPNLSPASQRKVDEGNRLCEVTAMAAELCHGSGVAFVIENPARSFLWRQAALRRALHVTGAIAALFDYCCFGAPWQKKT